MTATITTINPATGAPLQTYPAFSAEQIEQAVAQGHAAALAWGREPLATRVQAVRRLAAEHMLPEAAVPVLETLREHNPLLFDLVLKRQLRAGHQRLAASIFETRRFFDRKPA